MFWLRLIALAWLFAWISEAASAPNVAGTLDKWNLADNTFVVLPSDNGGLADVTDNAPPRAGKGYPYEAGERPPRIISRPGGAREGAPSDAPAIGLDVQAEAPK